MKSAFYFMLKSLLIFEIFAFLSWLFGNVEKRIDNKAMINFKSYDVADWIANNYDTHISQHLQN